MAKLKKYPKKPKSSASVAVLQNYIDRCKAIDKDNAQIKKDAQKKEQLKSKIAKMGRTR